MMWFTGSQTCQSMTTRTVTCALAATPGPSPVGKLSTPLLQLNLTWRGGGWLNDADCISFHPHPKGSASRCYTESSQEEINQYSWQQLSSCPLTPLRKQRHFADLNSHSTHSSSSLVWTSLKSTHTGGLMKAEQNTVVYIYPYWSLFKNDLK